MLMQQLRSFQKRMLLNYIFGSLIAVFGVGSIFIFHTLTLSTQEIAFLLGVMFVSVIIMLLCEFMVYREHIKPIKAVYNTINPTWETLEAGFIRAHRFPVLTVKRILIPHLLGLSVPATLLSLTLIYAGLVELPYYYIGLAWSGAILIAIMHALIEFFLTYQTVQPLLKDVTNKARNGYGFTLSIRGKYFLSIQKKLLATSIFTATFPVLLFILASQIRLIESSNILNSYWNWASIIIIVIFLLSLSSAILLYKNIKQPIEELQFRLEQVQSGTLQEMENIYSDEFFQLVTGFNHMVTGIKERDEQNVRLLESFFTVFAATLDARDPYTAGHSQRVAEYSVKIAEKAGFSENEIDLLRKSALLHDIGKIGVRDNVLLKEGRLTDGEYEQIKLHPVIGANILEQVNLPQEMKPLLPGVKYHHERYDGGGYPEGLRGENIPVFGRLMAVADAYDAMTSNRPYRNGMSQEKALDIIKGGKGTQWDPYFVDIFITIMETKNVKSIVASS